MKKILAIVIIFIVASVVVVRFLLSSNFFAGTYQYYFEGNKCDALYKSQRQQGLSDLTEVDNCYQGYAVQQKNVRFCNNIMSVAVKESCYWNVAIVKNDIAICEKIPTVENKEWCYHEIAQKNKNPKFCDRITSDPAKEKCRACLAGACPAIPTALNTPSLLFWDEALDMMKKGWVKSILQTEKDDLILTFNDTQASTSYVRMPVFNLFDEVKKCGAPCKDVEVIIQ